MVASKATLWEYDEGGPRTFMGMPHAEILALPILLPVWGCKAAYRYGCDAVTGVKQMAEPPDEDRPRAKKEGFARQFQRFGHWVTQDHPHYSRKAWSGRVAVSAPSLPSSSS